MNVADFESLKAKIFAQIIDGDVPREFIIDLIDTFVAPEDVQGMLLAFPEDNVIDMAKYREEREKRSEFSEDDDDD